MIKLKKKNHTTSIILVLKLMFTTPHHDKQIGDLTNKRYSGLKYSERWINSIQIFETASSIEKHDSVFIIMSQKNSKQP